MRLLSRGAKLAGTEARSSPIRITRSLHRAGQTVPEPWGMRAAEAFLHSSS